MNVCVRSYHLRLNEQQSAFNLLLSTSIKEKTKWRENWHAKNSPCVLYIHRRVFVRSFNTKHAEWNLLCTKHTFGWFYDFPFFSLHSCFAAISIFSFILSVQKKKCFFFVCYMCPHTHESRTAHFSSDGLRVFCQTIRVQLNMKMLQSFLLLSKTPNSSWMVFFPSCLSLFHSNSQFFIPFLGFSLFFCLFLNFQW